MHRRTFLAAVVAASAVRPRGASAQPAEDDAFPAFPNRLRGYERLPELTPAPGSTALGAAEPDEIDRRVARRLLELAPFACRPIEVAEFFRGVGQGEIPDLGDSALNARVGRHFVRGWPEQYNPVIVEFFGATSLRPLAPGAGGDATHWCAAFMNWCIARAGAVSAEPRSFSDAELATGTRSASSGSFRCWGEETAEPQYGDVIVWATDNTVNGCSAGPGHVGFYSSAVHADLWMTLGGNQRDPTRIEGARQNAVTCRAFPREFPAGRDAGGNPLFKRLHSFRTSRALHG